MILKIIDDIFILIKIIFFKDIRDLKRNLKIFQKIEMTDALCIMRNVTQTIQQITWFPSISCHKT